MRAEIDARDGDHDGEQGKDCGEQAAGQLAEDRQREQGQRAIDEGGIGGMAAWEAEGFDAAIEIHRGPGAGDGHLQQLHNGRHQGEGGAEQERLAPSPCGEQGEHGHQGDKNEEAGIAQRRDDQHQQVEGFGAQGRDGIGNGAVKRLQRPDAGLAQSETGKDEQAESGAQPLGPGKMHEVSIPQAASGSEP